MSRDDNDPVINPDKFLASVTRFLIQGQELFEASILLLCNVDITVSNSYYDIKELAIELLGNRAIL